MSSLDRILPFLKPIEDLLRDPSVTEVMVNDGRRDACSSSATGGSNACRAARSNRET